LERGGVVSGQGRVQEGARAAEPDPARRDLTNVEVADLRNRLPNAGLQHPLDSVHRRSLILFHFYTSPRFLPFVLDGQRQAVAEPLDTLEHTVSRLYDHGADLDQQLRWPYMRDRPSVCFGNVSEFHRALLCLFRKGRLDDHGFNGLRLRTAR